MGDQWLPLPCIALVFLVRTEGVNYRSFLGSVELSLDNQVLALQPQAAIVMPPEAARRLVAALSQTLQQHDALFGFGAGSK